MDPTLYLCGTFPFEETSQRKSVWRRVELLEGDWSNVLTVTFVTHKQSQSVNESQRQAERKGIFPSEKPSVLLLMSKCLVEIKQPRLPLPQ